MAYMAVGRAFDGSLARLVAAPDHRHGEGAADDKHAFLASPPYYRLASSVNFRALGLASFGVASNAPPRCLHSILAGCRNDIVNG